MDELLNQHLEDLKLIQDLVNELLAGIQFCGAKQLLIQQTLTFELNRLVDAAKEAVDAF